MNILTCSSKKLSFTSLFNILLFLTKLWTKWFPFANTFSQKFSSTNYQPWRYNFCFRIYKRRNMVLSNITMFLFDFSVGDRYGFECFTKQHLTFRLQSWFWTEVWGISPSLHQDRPDDNFYVMWDISKCQNNSVYSTPLRDRLSETSKLEGT